MRQPIDTLSQPMWCDKAAAGGVLFFAAMLLFNDEQWTGDFF